MKLVKKKVGRPTNVTKNNDLIIRLLLVCLVVITVCFAYLIISNKLNTKTDKTACVYVEKM